MDVERLTDALPAADGTWLLDAGSLRHGAESVDGPGWERLLADADSMYAVARRPATVVARVDPPGGSRELGPPGLDPVMDGAGQVAWVDADRCWNVLESRPEQPGRALLGPGADGVPIGLDDAGRGYLARATGITVVEPDGSIAWSFGADGIVLDGEVVVALAPAIFRTARAPAADVGRSAGGSIAPGRFGRGGEGARGPGVLAGADGTALLDDPAPPDARQRGWWPAAARDWQVDGSGRVHFTLAGPDGVAVVSRRGSLDGMATETSRRPTRSGARS